MIQIGQCGDAIKNLAIVVDTYHPKKDGVLTYLNNVIPMLKRKYRITLVAPRLSKEMIFGGGVNELLAPRMPLKINGYPIAMPTRKLIKALAKADSIFVHSLGPLGITALAIGKILRKPTTLFCHLDESLILSKILGMENRRLVPENWFRKAVDRLVRCLYKCADIIFVATDKFYLKLKRLKISDDKIVFTPLAVDLKRFSRNRNAGMRFRKKYGIYANAKVVLYLGRMSKEKNVEAIIRSVPSISSRCPSAHFVFAGGGVQLDAYKKLAVGTAPNSKITFTGIVPEKDLSSVYSMADVFVFPSLNESQAFVIMEAMAASTAVVVPKDRKSGYTYYERNKNCVFLHDPKNPGDISRKVIRLLNDRAMRNKIGANARKKIETYSWKEHVEKINGGLEKAEISRKSRKSRRRRLLDSLRRAAALAAG